MKLIFLGTGTSTGIPTIGIDKPVCKSSDFKDNRMRSSVVLQIGGKNILIDCSPDFRQQMLKSNISRIDAILITHEHSDHTAGLDDVRPISFRHGKIPIFAHKRVINNLERRFDYLFDSSSKAPLPVSCLRHWAPTLRRARPRFLPRRIWIVPHKPSRTRPLPLDLPATIPAPEARICWLGQGQKSPKKRDKTL